MSHLPHLQNAFQGFLLHANDADDIANSIVSDAKASSQQRLDIYAHAYRMRLSETLEQDFEALHTLLGDDQFHALCLSYLQAHPSQHYSLRYLGQHMSSFLRTHDLYARQPVLAELAAFEWAMTDAFDAADSKVVSLHELAGFAPEQWGELRYSAHPSVQRLELWWNVTDIWRATRQGEEPPAPQRGELGATWLIWRQELKTYFRSLSIEEVWAWQAACAGHNFGEICNGLCQWVNEETIPATAASLLQRWINDGLISEIRYPL